ncbi:MAG TPA: tagatose 1,6-diphosphate aldolase [Alphaproteobacteria bacterium]|nr:tagatose 1,6-diphosphate aldolase [Alphaproteobacteria bacterium]
MELSAGKLWGIRRLADDGGRFKMVAVDQRPPIMNLIKQKRGVAEASFEDVCAVKALLTRELAPHASAMLLDPLYAYSACIDAVKPSQGLLVTLEEHAFRETAGGRISDEIADWSVAKIKRLGADGVKVLAWYRPDADPEILRRQHDFVEKIGRACAEHDICYLLELLVYPLPGEDAQTKEYVEHKAKQPQRVVDSLEAFVDPKYGVDIFKLESPIPADGLAAPGSDGAAEAQAWFDRIGALTTRPWVMLSAGASMAKFRDVLHYAYKAGASGYLAGRAIWADALQNFPDMDKVSAALRAEGVPYMADLNRMTDAQATPWTGHRAFADGVRLAGAGPDFRRRYQSLPGAA